MIAILAVAAFAVLALLLAAAEPLLFRWYVREIGRVSVSPLPGEAVISYPLA